MALRQLTQEVRKQQLARSRDQMLSSGSAAASLVGAARVTSSRRRRPHRSLRRRRSATALRVMRNNHVLNREWPAKSGRRADSTPFAVADGSMRAVATPPRP
ncbi:MAG: hypothetical protein ACREM1_04590 [Longimicrobiales bacterium]